MAQKDRRQRRAAQSQAGRAHRHRKTAAGGGRRVRSKRERRRRTITWVAAIGLTVVLAAAAAAPLLFTSSSTSSAPLLTAHTLLRLPAASSLAGGPGAAYATDDRRDLLLRFDPGNGRVEGSLRLSGRPAAMVLDGRDLWVADMVDNQVVEVDAQTLHVVRSVPVPKGPSGLALLGAHVWVTSLAADEITSIDTRTGATGAPVHLVDGAVRVAAGFGALWTSGTTDMLTYFVPTSTRVRQPRLEGITVGRGPIGVTTGAGSAWVANAQDGTVSQVDPASLRVVHTWQVGGDPLSVGVAGGRVFVGDGTAQTLRTVSPSPPSKVLGIGTAPRALLPVDGAIWVAGASPGRVLSVSAG